MNRFVFDILPIIFIAIALLYIIFRWKRRRLYMLADNIPGRNGLPFIGQLHRFLNPDMRNYVKVIHEHCQPDIPFTKGWLGPKLALLTQDADTIHAMYNSPQCLNKPTFLYNALYSKLGLLSVNGAMYDKHRKIFNRSFKPSILQKLVPIFSEKAVNCVNILKEKVKKGEFNMYKFVGACSLETFGKAQLNFEKNFYGSDVLNAIESLKPLFMKRMFRPWFNINSIFKLSSLYKEMQKEYDVLVNFKKQVIEKNSTDNSTLDDEVFVKQITDEKNSFSEEEVLDELIIFIMAGYETSAITISSILLMLAIHKDVQQKVIEEIDQFHRSEDGMITIENLNKLPYTELVMKETMRLFTAGGIVARETSDEVTISGYTIPKGTVLVICAHEMHRNPTYWGSDANEFRPERFEPENIKNVNPHAYVPFSGGRRICIGYRYAMIFLKIFLVQFLKAYTVDTTLKYDELQIEMTPTLDIAQGYMMSVKERT